MVEATLRELSPVSRVAALSLVAEVGLVAVVVVVVAGKKETAKAGEVFGTERITRRVAPASFCQILSRDGEMRKWMRKEQVVRAANFLLLPKALFFVTLRRKVGP